MWEGRWVYWLNLKALMLKPIFTLVSKLTRISYYFIGIWEGCSEDRLLPLKALPLALGTFLLN